MLLIGQFDSPFVRRVAIALHHYGFIYEHRPWSVWAQAEEVAKFNPLRRVPILVLDDGEVLVESWAILDALDEIAADERRLLPRSGAVRRAGLRVSALATGLADKAVSLLYERVLRGDGLRSAVWTDRCRAQITATLELLEKERNAAGGPFWFGTLSHADVAVACALRFVREAHPGLWTEAGYPSLSAHAERCEAMPLFQSAVQALHVAV
ncbi:MAG: glutathione S-transferase family protein [Polyangiaceae bacterium]